MIVSKKEVTEWKLKNGNKRTETKEWKQKNGNKRMETKEWKQKNEYEVCDSRAMLTVHRLRSDGVLISFLKHVLDTRSDDH